jgi:tRNA threonylcarbamoyladenosine biosynthesis protein TsaB
VLHTLGIETSSNVGSVALVAAESGATPWDARTLQVLATASARVSNAHGESLLPLVQGVLRSARLTLAAIDLLAVGIGPGSFTGTRIAVATAKGIALGSGAPLRGVTSFDAIAVAARAEVGDELAVVIDARKGEVYCAIVTIGERDVTSVDAPLHLAPAAAAEWLARHPGALPVGDGVALVSGARPRRNFAPDTPRADAIAALAAARHQSAPLDEGDLLEPLYVRPPDVTLPTRTPGLPR